MTDPKYHDNTNLSAGKTEYRKIASIKWKCTETNWTTIKDSYSSGTLQVSTHLRTYGLAGFAIVWLFKAGDGSNTAPYALASVLLWGSGFLLLFLLLDIAQYLYKSLAWGNARNKVLENNPNPKDTDTSFVWDWINTPSIALFYLKIMALLGGYVCIFYHILTAIRMAP